MVESVRIAIAWHLPQYLAGRGVALSDVLEAVGLAPSLFDSPDNRLTFRDLGRLLLECERRTGSDEIGIEIGRHVRLLDFGLAGEIALSARTAGAGLRQFVEYFNLHSTATIVDLADQGEHHRFVYAITTLGMSDTRHFQVGSAVVSVNLLRDLFGPRWRPISVEVACSKPASHKALERYFDARTDFDAAQTAVNFEHRWLDARLPTADSRRSRELQEVARAQLEQMRQDWPATVRRVVRKQMLLGRFSMDKVASLLGVHRRTLDRRLDQFEIEYGQLVGAVRHDVASQLLRETNMPVHRIADSLHYSSAANFSTSFRHLEGVTPTAYRQQHRAGQTPGVRRDAS